MLFGFYWYCTGFQYQYDINISIVTGKDEERPPPVNTTLPSERIVFYNTENLFHPSDDSIKADEDFTPDGPYHWTYKRYYEKINKLGKLIVAIGEGRMPAIIGLCEVENRIVLKDILNKTILKRYSYKIIHKESPDLRGIDVALLYDAAKFLPLKYEFLDVSGGFFPEMKTRDILHVEGLFHDSAHCHIFVNHWPSRRGGQMASEAKRLAVAAMLNQYVDSCFIQDNCSNIIIMGDFNDEPGDHSLSHILGAEDPIHMVDSIMLYNLMYPYFRKGEGTHFRINNFREAAILDQIIVSKAVLFGKNGIKLKDDHARIYRNEFLLDKKNGIPLRTFQGLKYLGGFSDHLPVYTDIQIISSL